MQVGVGARHCAFVLHWTHWCVVVSQVRFGATVHIALVVQGVGGPASGPPELEDPLASDEPLSDEPLEEPLLLEDADPPDELLPPDESVPDELEEPDEVVPPDVVPLDEVVPPVLDDPEDGLPEDPPREPSSSGPPREPSSSGPPVVGFPDPPQPAATPIPTAMAAVANFRQGLWEIFPNRMQCLRSCSPGTLLTPRCRHEAPIRQLIG